MHYNLAKVQSLINEWTQTMFHHRMSSSSPIIWSIYFGLQSFSSPIMLASWLHRQTDNTPPCVPPNLCPKHRLSSSCESIPPTLTFSKWFGHTVKDSLDLHTFKFWVDVKSIYLSLCRLCTIAAQFDLHVGQCVASPILTRPSLCCTLWDNVASDLSVSNPHSICQSLFKTHNEYRSQLWSSFDQQVQHLYN